MGRKLANAKWQEWHMAMKEDSPDTATVPVACL